MTDKEFDKCMSAVKKGDKNALKLIYEEYLPYLYTVIFGVLGNREMAEDVSADCFIKLWQNADKYRPGNGHRAYLATMARNLALDELRKRKHEILQEEDDDTPGMDVASDADTETVSGISVTAAMEKLDEKERRIIDMKVLSDMTFKEISEILGVPMGTVTWRYREGIKKLKKVEITPSGSFYMNWCIVNYLL